MNKASSFFLSISSILCFNCKQINTQEIANKPFKYTQIITDSLYNSKQIISIIELQNTTKNEYDLEISYEKSILKGTSIFSKNNNALAAINGGFFDMDKGGSVTYFELNDTVISNTRSNKIKWGVSDSIINGAVIFKPNNTIEIEPKKTEEFYSKSNKELAVIITGPVLIYKTRKAKLADIEFINKRHPRTCLCETKESTLLITVDGRSKIADGMNLFELQDYLKNIGCLNAINLDGGGSTTMWIKGKGIVNNPSDSTGERPVANVLLIKKNY